MRTKTLFFIFLLAMLAMSAMSACKSEHESNPVFAEPTYFILNTPPFANMTYDLRHSEGVELTCVQPNYTYTAATTYTVQVSLDGDFDHMYRELPESYTTARIWVKAKDLSNAMADLCAPTIGGWTPFPTSNPIPVYIRLKARLSSGEERGVIYSNVIRLYVRLPLSDCWNTEFMVINGQILIKPNQ